MDWLLSQVIACVEQVLGTGEGVDGDTCLLERRDVDSIAIADLITAVEEATGLELAPADIVPATFATPAALARALAATAGQPREDGHGHAMGASAGKGREDGGKASGGHAQRAAREDARQRQGGVDSAKPPAGGSVFGESQ